MVNLLDNFLVNEFKLKSFKNMGIFMSPEKPGLFLRFVKE